MAMSDSEFAWLMVSLILYGMSFFILPYLWYLFWKLRNHFIISARFPKLTILMSISMYINVICAGILAYLPILNPEQSTIAYPIILGISMTVVYFFVTAIVFRAFLIYDLSLKEVHALNNQSMIITREFFNAAENAMIGTLRNAQNKTDAKQSNDNPNKTLKVVVIVTLTMAFILYSITLPGLLFSEYETLRVLFPIPFLSVIILGICILIKARKMKESMLCKRETYIIALLVLFSSTLNNITLPHHIELLLAGYQGLMYIYYLYLSIVCTLQ